MNADGRHNAAAFVDLSRNLFWQIHENIVRVLPCMYHDSFGIRCNFPQPSIYASCREMCVEGRRGIQVKMSNLRVLCQGEPLGWNGNIRLV